ncbi:MAG TPA: radical SAM family heme chaperone HemW [Pseudobacteroides sp.]|nr:radical SAM family heme chaperone HemW [Pseudobacteroides sp.]
MNEDDKKKYNEWKEYPERDTRGTIWYPPSLGEINPNDIWEKKEIGFYVHIPFCKSICKYCPFNRYRWSSEAVESYLRALKSEISIFAENNYIKNSKIVAGYFGGGTPTTLNNEQLIDLITFIKEKFNINEKIEITVEANPTTVDKEKLKTLTKLGVTRLSLGVQSFNDRILKSMGCSHTVEQAVNAIKIAKEVGFDSVNIDLLYNIPGQTLQEWEYDLNKAIELQLDHISPMCLFVDSSSELFEAYYSAGNLPRQLEDLELDMYKLASKKLNDNGYHMYTLYDYAKPDKECEHHKLNWKAPQGEYMGLGAGAISHINNYVYVNVAKPEIYNEKISNGTLPVAFGKKLTKEDEMSRFMVFGFYCLSVSKSEFKKQFGIEIEVVFENEISKLQNWGLISNSQDTLALTEKGMKYLYNVSSAFYQEEYKYYPEDIKLKVQPKVL